MLETPAESARGGTRTPMPFRAPDPKSGAYTNSATFAFQTIEYRLARKMGQDGNWDRSDFVRVLPCGALTHVAEVELRGAGTPECGKGNQ